MKLPVLQFWLFSRWYGPWIGVYIDAPNKTIYVCPVPMFGVKIKWRMEGVRCAKRTR